MAFTIGKYGIASVINLAMLVATFELTSFLFIVVILGAVCFYNDFSVFALICYIKEKAALSARHILVGGCVDLADGKDRKAGAKRSAVGLVIPHRLFFQPGRPQHPYDAGCAVHCAGSRYPPHPHRSDPALLVAILSSKGAAGVTGAGFITLAATLSVVPTVPVAGMGLILGINRFMSEYLTTTNFIGNDAQTKSRIDPNAGFGRSLVKSMRKQEAKQVGCQRQPAWSRWNERG